MGVWFEDSDLAALAATHGSTKSDDVQDGVAAFYAT